MYINDSIHSNDYMSSNTANFDNRENKNNAILFIFQHWFYLNPGYVSQVSTSLIVPPGFTTSLSLPFCLGYAKNVFDQISKINQ